MPPATLRAAMRRLLAILLPVLVLLVAGCGGGDSGSALDSTLAYLPKDTSFAAAIDTDTGGDQYKALAALLDKFPFGDQVKAGLLQQFEKSSGGIRYDEDLKPVLGNPLVIGAAEPQAVTNSSNNAFVVAIKAKDTGALDDLVGKLKLKKDGEASGATLYRDGDTFVAVKDDMLVSANDESRLKSALEGADGDDHFDEDRFNTALEDLPDSALVRVYADVQKLMTSDPGGVPAQRVKWIGALRKLGLTATAKDDSIDIDFRAATEGDLTDDDLPIAPGEDAPPVIKRRGEVGLGIRDLAHVVRWAESAAQAIDPSGFGDYERAKQTIDSQLGVNLDRDLIGQLTGNVAASLALGGDFGVRAELRDPRAFERTLVKVADVLPSFAEGAGLGRVTLTKPRRGGDFYELRGARGGKVVFGVSNDVFVVASKRARAVRLAREEPTAVEGASGSVALGADAEELVGTFLQQYGSALGLPDLGGLGTSLMTQPLGDLNGYVSASTDELRGKLTLTIK
jgi:Protein of unknown function (DUF3352)